MRVLANSAVLVAVLMLALSAAAQAPAATQGPATAQGPAAAVSGPAPTVVTSADALSAAFAAGAGTAQLGSDIAIDSLEVPDGGAIALDLAGHVLTVDNRGGSDAAIMVASGSSLTIEDSSPGKTGKLAALAARGAGIGGGDGGGTDAGTVTITGGTITATSSAGAGIGGGNSYGGANGGSVTIDAGTVTATGGAAAGIGGGNAGGSGAADGGTVVINGGTVTAVGSSGGAGIGGGSAPGPADGGSVTITGGIVTATGSAGGADIGGGTSGQTASGAALVVGAHGTLVATGGDNAIGPGTGPGSTAGTFSNAGDVTIDAGTATLDGATNTGALHNNAAIVVTNTLQNDGTITGTAPTPESAVIGNNFTIVAPDHTFHFFAATGRAVGVTLPTPAGPPPTGTRFAGWSAHADGKTGKHGTVNEETSLRKAFGAGPLTVTLGDPVYTKLPPSPVTRATALSPTTMLWAGLIAGGVVLLGILALIVSKVRGRNRPRASASPGHGRRRAAEDP